MIILSRFQRMGHDIVLIIGDITAKIGDPPPGVPTSVRR